MTDTCQLAEQLGIDICDEEAEFTAKVQARYQDSLDTVTRLENRLTYVREMYERSRELHIDVERLHNSLRDMTEVARREKVRDKRSSDATENQIDFLERMAKRYSDQAALKRKELLDAQAKRQPKKRKK